MANPKLLRPLPKSILDPQKWKLAHCKRYLLKNQNRKVELLLQE